MRSKYRSKKVLSAAQIRSNKAQYMKARRKLKSYVQLADRGPSKRPRHPDEESPCCSDSSTDSTDSDDERSKSPGLPPLLFEALQSMGVTKLAPWSSPWNDEQSEGNSVPMSPRQQQWIPRTQLMSYPTLMKNLLIHRFYLTLMVNEN